MKYKIYETAKGENEFIKECASGDFINDNSVIFIRHFFCDLGFFNNQLHCFFVPRSGYLGIIRCHQYNFGFR